MMDRGRGGGSPVSSLPVGKQRWGADGCAAPSKGEVVKCLPFSSNILSTTIASLDLDSAGTKNCLIATTADRRLHILSLSFPPVLYASHAALSDAPILSCTALSTRILLCTTMSGTLLAITPEGQVLDKRKDHSKYVVACAIFRPSGRSQEQTTLVATAGWDNKVLIYRPSPSDDNFTLNDPIATIPLQTKPEALLFLTHPDTAAPILLLSRTDSSFLVYYTFPSLPSTSPELLGKQNLAPHSNAWVAFTPSSLALHPTDPTLLAVATNSIPHMKVLVVRLLVPPLTPDPALLSRPSLLDDPAAPPRETQASQARLALAVADREHAAITLHANTLAPQTAYSTPCVAWRPDGSGVWVNGDDGVVRAVEVGSGRGVVGLGEGSGGHEAGAKVRCLASGFVGDDGEGERGEVVVSGGFDQRLVVWRADAEA